MLSYRFDRLRSSAPAPELLPAHRVDRRRIRTATAIAIAGTAALTCLGGASASAASNASPVLAVSATANRTAPASLHGQHLGGRQYIFVSAPRSAHVGSVYFYLDGTLISHEKSAPFDLLGGTASRANALKISGLSAGKHTVKATVKMAHQTTWLTGAFVSGTVSGTPASATATATGSALEVSAHPNRTAATTLHGQTLSGAQYVFVDAGNDKVSSVTFYLDGNQTALERKVPYDMYGGTATAAVPLRVDNLTAGTHTVTATVKTSTTTRHLRGAFAVAGKLGAVTATDPASDPTTRSAATTPTPTPTATPTPTPTPVPSLASAPTPSATPSGQTDLFDPVTFDWTSVGGPTQTTGSSVTLSTAGAVLTDCNIGTLHVDAANVTVKNCTVNGGIFGAGSYTLERNFITSGADGIDPTGDGYKVIRYNKIWRDGTRVADKHHDGIQFWRGGNALITRNWISGFQTSAIMVKADQATISNVTIDSNYLNNPTGYFQLYLCPDSHALRNITVTNNAFGKSRFTASTCGANLTFVHTEAQRQAAINAGNAGAATWIVWNNNYVAGTDAIVAPPGGWAE